MMKVYFVMALIMLTTSANAATSIEAVEPSSTCDRFLDSKGKKTCLGIVKTHEPDSYHAAVCEKVFSNEAFLECLKLSKNYLFDPKKLQACASDEVSDEVRLNCLSQIGNSIETQTRLPASQKTKKKAQRLGKGQRHSR